MMNLIQFEQTFPVDLVDYAGYIVAVVAVVGLVYKFRSWAKTLPSGFFREARAYLHWSGMTTMFFSELVHRVLRQRLVFRDSVTRRIIHLMVFWGFVGLVFATLWDDVFYKSGSIPTPFTTQNFGNVVGNIAGAVLLIGLIAIVVRYAIVTEFRKNYKGDLVFLTLLFLTTLTGFATELSRFSTSGVAFTIYAAHLIFIGALFLAAPFTHFFHALLAPFMRYVGRINDTLTDRGVNPYPFYRKLQMANQADDIRAGKSAETYPYWLEKKPAD